MVSPIKDAALEAGTRRFGFLSALCYFLVTTNNNLNVTVYLACFLSFCANLQNLALSTVAKSTAILQILLLMFHRLSSLAREKATTMVLSRHLFNDETIIKTTVTEIKCTNWIWFFLFVVASMKAESVLTVNFR